MKIFICTSIIILLFLGFIYTIYVVARDFFRAVHSERDLKAKMLREQEEWKFDCKMEQKLEDIEERRYEYGNSYWTEEDSKLQNEYEKTRMRWEDDDLPF